MLENQFLNISNFCHIIELCLAKGQHCTCVYSFYIEYQWYVFYCIWRNITPLVSLCATPVFKHFSMCLNQCLTWHRDDLKTNQNRSTVPGIYE